MYERFLQRYVSDAGEEAEEPRRPWKDASVSGFNELMDEIGPRSFNNGLYRLHSESSGRQADAWVGAMFPDERDRGYCFGYDWLGSQYSLDLRRLEAGEPQVMYFDPATGEAFEVDRSFREFHTIEMMDPDVNPVGERYYRAWAATDPRRVPLKRTECVGYKIPLFLGGKDEIGNMEVVDLDVYWTFAAQMLGQIRELTEGTPISGVKGK